MTSQIRAWHVHDGDPGEASELVFAASRNRACSLSCSAGPLEWEYQHTSAVRAPLWDAFADRERVIEHNDQLPKEAPRFYAEWSPPFTPDQVAAERAACRKD